MDSTTAPAPPHLVVTDILTDAERTAWFTWGLGGGAVVLVTLGVLAVLYRRGLLCNGSARLRRPSHAQPWRHWDWGSPRSRLPSLFDLLHVPRKSTAGMLEPSDGGAPSAPAAHPGHTLAPPGPPPFTISTLYEESSKESSPQPAAAASTASRPQQLLPGRQGRPSVVIRVD